MINGIDLGSSVKYPGNMSFFNHLCEKLPNMFIKFVHNIKLDGVTRILDMGEKIEPVLERLENDFINKAEM